MKRALMLLVLQVLATLGMLVSGAMGLRIIYLYVSSWGRINNYKALEADETLELLTRIFSFLLGSLICLEGVYYLMGLY